jgi:hemoglobin-like flavoprotein
MTPQQKELVRSTWIRVVPVSEQVAELFYGRLFELNPALRPLFKGDMKQQGAKLMKTIGLAVSTLDNLDPMIDTLKELGARHAVYGVKEEDYDTVAAALLWTLEKGLGDHFTAEANNAWAVVYGALAEVMKAGATEARAA